MNLQTSTKSYKNEKKKKKKKNYENISVSGFSGTRPPFPFECIRTACRSPRDCPKTYPICVPGVSIGTCCRRRRIEFCPRSIQGPRCGPRFPPCKRGYTCLRFRCCLNRCPANLRGPRCRPYFPWCKRGYTCYKGYCCRNFH